MKLLYKAHLLNIDTALGAVVSSNFIAKILGLALPWTITASLFISVLIIYNFDHLSDAHRISGQAQTVRHQFYKDHNLALKLLQIVLMLMGVWLIYLLPVEIIKGGSIIVLTIVLYFILLEIFPLRLIFFKEISIAAIYALSIFLAPVILTTGNFSTEMGLLMGQYFLLAFMNLIIFSLFDKDIDQLEGHPSLVNIIGVNKVIVLTYYVFALLCACVFFSFLFIKTHGLAQILLLLMGLILLFIMTRVNVFKQNDRFRIIGDSVFLLPCIYLLLV